jgi:hypothetical protein
MYRHWLPLVTAICLAPLAAGRLPAQDKQDKPDKIDKIDKLVKELDAEKGRFIKQKEAAKQKVLKDFDAVIKKVANNPNVKPADRLAIADKLKADRAMLAEKEDLPESSDVLPAIWENGASLVQKYRPLSKKFDQAMNACLKAGQEDRAQQLKADKETFDSEHLPGRKHFAAGAFWTGSRYDEGKAILFNFRVTQLTGSVFKARAEQDMQFAGHPVFDLGGSLDGIAIQCNSLNSVQGNLQMARCEGVVIGESMLLQVVTVPRKGPPKTSYIALRKRK